MIALKHSDPVRSNSLKLNRTYGLWLKAKQRIQPTVEYVGSLTILTPAKGIPAVRQRKQLLRLMRQLPANRTRLILDVSTLDDEDNGLTQLIGSCVDQARRCRFDICVAGLSKSQQALLEFTRVTQFVRCFATRTGAIQGRIVSTDSTDRLGRTCLVR